MATDKHLQFLEQLTNHKPNLASDVSKFATLYQRKLWHQLTIALEEAFVKPEFQEGDVMIHVYNNFVDAFALKLKALRLASLAVVVSKQFADPADALAFLEGVITKVGVWIAVCSNVIITCTHHSCRARHRGASMSRPLLWRSPSCACGCASHNTTCNSATCQSAKSWWRPAKSPSSPCRMYAHIVLSLLLHHSSSS